MPGIIIEDNKNPNQKNEESKQEEKKEQKTSLKSILRRFGSEGVLDAAAAQYISNIRDIVEDKAHLIPVSTLKVKDSIYAFRSNNHAVILTIDPMVGTNYAAIRDNRAVAEALNAFKDIARDTVVNVVVVTKHDYERYPQMASYITRCLMSNTGDFDDLTISKIKGEYQLVIDTDPLVAKRFIDRNSPVSTQCVEFGFTVSFAPKDEIIHHGRSVELDEVMAVGGYVEFVRSESIPGTPIKFIPIIHISEISALIPSLSMLPIAIERAADIFIGRGLWKQAYTSNLTKKGINIGNLIEDENGKPWAATKEIELIEFFSKYIDAPILALDVVTGHPRIPGLGAFIDDHERVLKITKEFFDGNIVNTAPSSPMFEEVIGIAEVSSDISQTGLIDTRMFTYLLAVNALGLTPGVSQLLYRYQDPTHRIETIRNQIQLDAYPTAMNYVAMLDDTYVRTLADLMRGLKISVPTMSSNQVIDLSVLGNRNYVGSGFVHGGFSSAKSIII